MTFEENFKRVKDKFNTIDKKKLSAINEDIAMEVNITDDDSNGLFYIAYINGVFAVEPYDYYDHTVRISLGANDFVKLIDRKVTLENLVKKGAVAIDKNFEHAKIIFELKDKPIKKAAASSTKETAKKTADKVKKAVKKVDKAAQNAKEKLSTLPEKEEVIKAAEKIAKTVEKTVETAAKTAEKKLESTAKAAEKAVNSAKEKAINAKSKKNIKNK